MTSVTVINLPRFDTQLRAHDVIRFGKKLKPIKMNDLIDLIEYELLDIVEMYIKHAIHNTDIPYYILGGKAINNAFSISKRSTLSRSFDFDIHVRNHEDVTRMSSAIASNANSYSKQYYMKVYKKMIFYKLRELNLVTDADKDYYFNNGNTDLFCYGDRLRRQLDINIPSVMLILKLRNDLFRYDNGNLKTYTNMLPNPIPIERSHLFNYDLTHSPDPDHTIIYLPVIDIARDTSLNNGVVVLKDPETTEDKIQNYTIKSTYDNLVYSNIFVSVFNLIRMIASRTKIDKNISKLKHLFNTNNFSCEILHQMDNDAKIDNFLAKILGNIPPNISTLTVDADYGRHDGQLESDLKGKLKIGNIDLLNCNYSQIMRILMNILKRGNRNNYIPTFMNNRIESNVPTSSDVNTEQKISISIEDTNNLSVLSFTEDSPERIAYIYTSTIYHNINNWCNYKYHKLLITPIEEKEWEDTIPAVSRSLNIPNTTHTITIDTKILTHLDYEDLVTKLDLSIEKFCRALGNNPDLFNRLPQYFQTITYQNIVNLTAGISGVFGISDLKQGDIFKYPQFISTTYDLSTDLEYFAKNGTRSIMRINIPKTSKKWIFMGKYSHNPTENEIIIKRNTTFIVTKISSAVIKFNTPDNSLTEYRLIDVDIIDDNNQLLRAISQINPDIINMSPLFVVAAKYAYENHLSKSYEEVKIGEEAKRNEEIPLQNYRPIYGLAHSLRTATYIQLIGEMIKSQSNTSEIYKNLLTPKLIQQASIAAIFMVTGRINEIHDTTVYSAKSATNFETFVNVIGLNDENSVYGKIYTDADIIMFKDLFKNYSIDGYRYGDIQNNKNLCAYLFKCSHDMDQSRYLDNTLIRDTISIAGILNQNENNTFYKNIVIAVIEATGDKMRGGTTEAENHDYRDALFYQSNIDPVECITNINSVIGSKIQDLINENKMPSDLVVPQTEEKDPGQVRGGFKNLSCIDKNINIRHEEIYRDENIIINRELYRPLLSYSYDSDIWDNITNTKLNIEEKQPIELTQLNIKEKQPNELTQLNIKEKQSIEITNLLKSAFHPIHRKIVVCNIDRKIVVYNIDKKYIDINEYINKYINKYISRFVNILLCNNIYNKQKSLSINGGGFIRKTSIHHDRSNRGMYINNKNAYIYLKVVYRF
jgi:hypothetical protein